MKIYVASSWRNYLQPGIVLALRRNGHHVYDFRNPPNKSSFQWKDAGLVTKPCTAEQLREAWRHPVAVAGYAADIEALRACDAVVYVLPCGRSASWEFGYAMGQGKRGYVVQFAPDEPELMFSEATVIASMAELWREFGEPREETGG